MNNFDYSILSALNGFSNHHPLFDEIIYFIGNNSFIKAGFIVAICCWEWFKNGEGLDKNRAGRETILSALVASTLSILIARFAVLALPFRVRPICDPTNGLHFYNPEGLHWENWSSFPSDHAILFFTLTTCFFFISRAAGWITLLHSTFVVCLPRIYLGIHYPTDILAGAAIGVGIGLLASRGAIKSAVAKVPLQWMVKYPGPYYAAFFLFMYEVSVLYNDARTIVVEIMHHLKEP